MKKVLEIVRNAIFIENYKLQTNFWFIHHSQSSLTTQKIHQNYKFTVTSSKKIQMYSCVAYSICQFAFAIIQIVPVRFNLIKKGNENPKSR